MAVTSPQRAPVAGARRRRRRISVWLLPAGAAMLILLPVVLLAGAGNPPCATALSTVSTPVGPAGAGVFAQPLKMLPGRWYQVGATEYGGTFGSSGAYLPAVPDSFAELSLLDRNPYPAFTFADADALDEVPYGTAIRVAANGRQVVLVKRDIGYGQGPGQALPYRIDIYAPAAAVLGVSKQPVAIRLAPSAGAGALLGQIPPPAAPGPPSAASQTECVTAVGAPLTLIPGPAAKILPSGLAAAPQDAPAAVKRAIAAGNQLIAKPYLYGGGHGQPLTRLAASYDCSSSTSYVLHGGGVFGTWPEDSTQLESYGDLGPGRWITVYANSAHAFVELAGIVLDTAWYAPVEPTGPGSGPRWQPASIIGPQYAGDSAAGNGGFIQRHPHGL